MACYLLDTNVVLRLMDRNATEHLACRSATEALNQTGHTLVLAPQVLYEFWVVSTRPKEQRGFGWTATKASEALTYLLSAFLLYPETPKVFDAWRRLVLAHQIVGKRAHDARLIAFKEAHAIPYVITLNSKDFTGLTAGILTPEQARGT
jgi:predicted nucleic acid-binding protein